MSQDLAREWATYFFDRPASPDEPDGEIFDDDDFGIDHWIEDHELEALGVVAELHERYAEWAALYDAAQLSQGLWAMFSYPYFWRDLINNQSQPFEPRARVVRSLAVPYDVFVKGNPEESLPNGWWMLWDLIGGPEETAMADVYLGTLQRILRIDDGRCQQAAMHGLNHLNHPDRPEVVQQWLNEHADASWDSSWVEQCRDGLAM